MAGEAPEPHWLRQRREKRASHKEVRREGAVEAAEN
jgi:tRNA-splicing ligase RtcB (3'-phosphate/5'-hydroxy nucleic acid ligase)